MQWYLSHAGNTVHLIADLDRPMPRDEFEALVASCIMHFPELRLAEDRASERFVPLAQGHETEIAQYASVAQICSNPATFLDPAQDLFDRHDASAFRAICHSLAEPGTGQPACRLYFAASHSLVEGADLAALLRGKVERRARRAVRKHGLSRAVRWGLGMVAPVLALIHIVAAKAEKRKATDFGFTAVEMSRPDIEAAARKLGISKRGLIFAMTLFTLAGRSPRKPAVRFAYSKLPPQRIHLEDDAFLSARVQFMATRRSEDFKAFAQMLDRELARQDESEVLTQFLANRVLKIQRWLSALSPWLHRGAFFGFAPYDMVLSLLPPVMPNGPFAALAEARLFGGSYTGTVPNVIFLCTTRNINWTCWLEHCHSDRLEELAQVADSLGIGHKIWRQIALGDQER